MDELTQLRQELENLKQEFNLFRQQDMVLDQVSDVTDDLGDVRAGRFLALTSGIEPTDSNACGSFKSGSRSQSVSVLRIIATRLRAM